MHSSAVVHGLRVADPLWLSHALHVATETHEWPKGVPAPLRECLEEISRAAAELHWRADLVATLLASNGVDGVDGVEFEDVIIEDADDDREPWMDDDATDDGGFGFT